ncbi:MAG TPA: Gfo/Idh/MocA family oxidoreductase [Ktedonobacteraceae bacterium]|nr:Gfo/Idh/MocA family oxidoreductase [Ktedonobacteraceae bacterium]
MQNPQTPRSTPVRWGVLSVANIGVKRVIPAILASASEELVAVASRNIQRAQEKFAHLPGLRLYGDYESLLRDPEIEAIYNPLPNSLHAEWTIRALEAGKHVLCEKPMAVTAEQGQTMVEAAQANGKLLMEAFMYRFHPQTIWALEQVHSGRIGNVKLVRSSFSFNIMTPPHPHNIRLQAALAGGSLMDVGCYPINFCRAVYGHAPVAVAGRVFSQSEGEVEIAASAALDFGAGRLGLIDSSFELPTRQVSEVIGDAGSITIPLPFTPPIVDTEVILSVEGQVIHQRITAVDHYRLEVEHFGTCIRTGAQPAYSFDETLDNLRTIEAVYLSAGHRWPLS